MKSLFLIALFLFLSPLVLAEEKSEIPQVIPDLIKAVFSQRIQLISHLAPNCSAFPNATQEEQQSSQLSFFGFIPPSASQAASREQGSPLFVAGGESPLGQYVPLLNGLNAAVEAASGTFVPFSLRVVVVERTRFEEPVFGTFDLQQGLFLLNQDMLRYLPATPSASLAHVYQLLGEKILQAKQEDFTLEGFPQLIKEHVGLMAELLQQDPVACFFCVVIGGTLLMLAANILAYRYSLLVCATCGLSDAQCFYVSLYYLMLVYQNLPLLAAVLFALCYDVCVAAPQLIMAGL